jgi:hypothetical protein
LDSFGSPAILLQRYIEAYQPLSRLVASLLSTRRFAKVFHLLFKTLALVVYIFSGIFTSNFIFVAVVTILLLAFDFWTVKNVTGRLLVGLRWWNYVKEVDL